ncbi:MAG: type II secretion system F family protein [Burkholderiales bacterium]
MALFRYEAIDARGGTVEGQIDADSSQEALQKLGEQALTPTKLEDQSGVSAETVAKAPSILGFAKSAKVKVGEQILIIRELSTLLRAGITLVDAVDSLALSRVDTPAGLGLRRAHRSLNAGTPFVKALEETKIEFPQYVFQLAATGEMTGKLSSALADGAKQMEYDDRIQQEMRNSLTYPIILVVAGVAAVLLIFLVVVPKFANLVKGSRAADIPEISLAVIKLGVFLQANWLWLFLLVAAGAGLFYLSIRDADGRTQWLTRLSTLPLVGEWLTEAEIGRWATTLGALLANRVPILSALELSAGGLRFAKMRERVNLVIRDVRGGATLADAAARYRLVGATGVNLIRVGEKSGELPQTVATLGELSMEAGRNRMRRFLVLIEPLAILIIGGVIGFIMVAIMMAITGLSAGRL